MLFSSKLILRRYIRSFNDRYMKIYILPKYNINRKLMFFGHYFKQSYFDVITYFRFLWLWRWFKFISKSILTVNPVFTSGQEAFYDLSVSTRLTQCVVSIWGYTFTRGLIIGNKYFRSSVRHVLNYDEFHGKVIRGKSWIINISLTSQNLAIRAINVRH